MFKRFVDTAKRLTVFIVVWGLYTVTVCASVFVVVLAFNVWSGATAARALDNSVYYAVLLPGNALVLWIIYLFAGLTFSVYTYVVRPR